MSINSLTYWLFQKINRRKTPLSTLYAKIPCNMVQSIGLFHKITIYDPVFHKLTGLIGLKTRNFFQDNYTYIKSFKLIIL